MANNFLDEFNYFVQWILYIENQVDLRDFMSKKFLRGARLWIVFFVLIIVGLVIVLSRTINKTVLIIEHVHVTSSGDIRSFQDSMVAPIAYDNVNMLGELSMEERKEKFIQVVLPAIMIARHNMLKDREQLEIILEKMRFKTEMTQADSQFVVGRMEKYRLSEVGELRERLTPHPVSIALAQAALESGWGTSRFFKVANNVFGMWSFRENEPRILASYRREGKPVYLKKYENIQSSVQDYFRLLSTAGVYEDFRRKRMETDNVFELIWYLKKYSEQRNRYVILLRDVIVANDLTKFDSYIFDPAYFDYPPDESAMF
jgi:Bax protein